MLHPEVVVKIRKVTLLVKATEVVICGETLKIRMSIFYTEPAIKYLWVV